MPIRKIIIGAASPLGATLLDQLARSSDDGAILVMDASDRVAMLREFANRYGVGRVDIAIADPLSEVELLRPEVLEELRDNVTQIFDLSFDFNRRRATAALSRANENAVRYAISLAKQAKNLQAMVSVTDVGVAGDYPGRFYESWLNVSQQPLDEVDATSLRAELTLLATELPVVRARIGLLSDPDPDLFFSEKWPCAARVLVPTLPFLKYLPRMISIPTIIDEGSLAPVSPLPWTARALAALGAEPNAPGKAVHLVLGEPIPMGDLLSELHQAVGGARVKGGVPVHLLDALAEMPGINETLRRRFDQLSSLWTPHRYCLSRNDLDTSIATSLLSKVLAEPRWEDVRLLFFRHLG